MSTHLGLTDLIDSPLGSGQRSDNPITSPFIFGTLETISLLPSTWATITRIAYCKPQLAFTQLLIESLQVSRSDHAFQDARLQHASPPASLYYSTLSSPSKVAIPLRPSFVLWYRYGDTRYASRNISTRTHRRTSTSWLNQSLRPRPPLGLPAPFLRDPGASPGRQKRSVRALRHPTPDASSLS